MSLDISYEHVINTELNMWGLLEFSQVKSLSLWIAMYANWDIRECVRWLPLDMFWIRDNVSNLMFLFASLWYDVWLESATEYNKVFSVLWKVLRLEKERDKEDWWTSLPY